jgi:sulfite exporter TauE/SafE
MLLFAGLVAGLIHVLSGPDHLAAIAPLATRNPHRSWNSGLRWGLGHSAGVVAVGLLSLLVRGWIPVDLISRFSDRIVGLMLIGIGVWALRSALKVHTHKHTHDNVEHEHFHMHAATSGHVHTHAAFGIGALHGLAGSSHFLGVLPAMALPSTALSVAYLLSFGLGTVCAMVAFSHAVGVIAKRFTHGGITRAYRAMMFTCSALAFVTGVLWMSGLSA